MKEDILNTKYFLNGIGIIKLKSSDKAKLLRISIDAYGEVKIVIPKNIKQEDAITFVSSKKSWIKKNKRKLKAKIILSMDLSHSQLQTFWENTENKVKELSSKYGFCYKKVIFKTYKAKWGSCSSKNVISINNLLYYLPDYLKEYVILHELMHIKIKNHSAYFWYSLELICKNAKLKRKELRDNYIFG